MLSIEAPGKAAWCRVSALVSLLLCAAFAAAGRSIPQQPPAPMAPLPPAAREPFPSLPSTSTHLTVQPAFSVVIDAAHGGPNSGARLAVNLAEKNVTLSLSVHLRSALMARGIAVTTTRESDADRPFDERAGMANHAFAAACLVLHATATGNGVHLFTSSLAPAPAPAAMAPWQTVQAGWVTRSLRLSSEISSALGQAGIPVTLGSTLLQPLDNLSCPAVAIEIAPPAASAADKNGAGISDANYQERILDALASAMLEWSIDWKQQP